MIDWRITNARVAQRGILLERWEDMTGDPAMYRNLSVVEDGGGLNF